MSSSAETRQEGHGERRVAGQHADRYADAGDRDGGEADQARDKEQGDGPARGE